VHSGVLARYREYLPITGQTPMLTLGEGDTPLVSAPRLAAEVGCAELFFKLEGCNPTGSFKDRGMVVAVAKAVEEGRTSIICASTGNTSASAAAYGAKFGLKTYVLIPKGNIAAGKLAQAVAHGATVVEVKGNFDEALSIVRQLSEAHPIGLVNSVNPYRLEGQKSAAFEVVEALGDAPDLVCIPVGNAGNIAAYWRGFKQFHQLGKSAHLPQMMGFQAAGAAPIVLGARVEHPQTIATAIRIGNPASWKLATAARDESNGRIEAVTDAEILSSYQAMARQEGVFGEPASAAPFAGLRKLAREGFPLAGKRVVCIVTGNGLKDPHTAMELPADMHDVDATYEAVEALIAGR